MENNLQFAQQPCITATTSAELTAFAALAEQRLASFSNKGFFSEFIALCKHLRSMLAELALIADNSAAFIATATKIEQSIASKQSALLAFWGKDVAVGFELLQNCTDQDAIAAVKAKFASNHHAHAEDIVNHAATYPDASAAFFQVISEALNSNFGDGDDDTFLGMSAVAQRLKISIQDMHITYQQRIEYIQEEFNYVAETKQKILQDLILIQTTFNELENYDVDDLLQFQDFILSGKKNWGEFFNFLQEDIVNLDGDAGIQAAHFFSQVRNAAPSHADFEDCSPDTSGVKQALLNAIARRLAELGYDPGNDAGNGAVPDPVKELPKGAGKGKGPDPGDEEPKGGVPPGDDIPKGGTNPKVEYARHLLRFSTTGPQIRQDLTSDLNSKLTLNANITQDEFAALHRRLVNRIDKHTDAARANKPIVDDADRAAREIYAGSKSTMSPQKDAFDMRDKSKAAMFDVALLDPNAGLGGIELTFANSKPSNSELVAGAEVMKDAVELLAIKNKKVEGIEISDYEDDLAGSLAMYCSLACQELPIRFAGTAFAKADANNKGIYEVLKLFEQLRESAEGRKILMNMLEDDNQMLNAVIAKAKELCLGEPAARGMNLDSVISQLATEFHFNIRSSPSKQGRS